MFLVLLTISILKFSRSITKFIISISSAHVLIQINMTVRETYRSQNAPDTDLIFFQGNKLLPNSVLIVRVMALNKKFILS